MKCLFLLLMKFLMVFNLYSKDLYEYKFNWYPRIIVEDDVIVFPTPALLKDCRFRDIQNLPCL